MNNTDFTLFASNDSSGLHAMLSAYISSDEESDSSEEEIELTETTTVAAAAAAAPRVRTRKSRQTYNIKDAKEIMSYISDIMDLIFTNSECMENGVFVELMDKCLEMSCGSFYIELLEAYEKSTPRTRPPPIPKTEMRRFVQQHPDKGVICELCNTPLMNSSYKAHLGSVKCKDACLVIKKAGGCVADRFGINEKVIIGYDEPPTETTDVLGDEHSWHFNNFNN